MKHGGFKPLTQRESTVVQTVGDGNLNKFKFNFKPAKTSKEASKIVLNPFSGFVKPGGNSALTQNAKMGNSNKGLNKRRLETSLENPTAKKQLFSTVVKADLLVHIKKKDTIAFSESEFSALKKFIAQKLDAIPESDFYPLFNQTNKVRNFVSIECADSQSADWLKENLPGIASQWESGEISVLRSSEIPKLARGVFVVPSSLDDSFELNKFKTRLKRANKGLNVDSWEFWNMETNSYGGKVVFFGMDSASVEFIKKKNNKVFYLTGKLQVNTGSGDSGEKPTAKSTEKSQA